MVLGAAHLRNRSLPFREIFFEPSYAHVKLGLCCLDQTSRGEFRRVIRKKVFRYHDA